MKGVCMIWWRCWNILFVQRVLNWLNAYSWRTKIQERFTGESYIKDWTDILEPKQTTMLSGNGKQSFRNEIIQVLPLMKTVITLKDQWNVWDIKGNCRLVTQSSVQILLIWWIPGRNLQMKALILISCMKRMVRKDCGWNWKEWSQVRDELEDAVRLEWCRQWSEEHSKKIRRVQH